jgi:hypothetical protein
MNIKPIGLTLAFCFLGAAACVAADPQMGAWKPNESKSKITPGTLKNTQVVYSSLFGQVKIKADGIDANGKPQRTEWSGKLDRKDYPVTGDPNLDVRSYTKVDERTLTTTNKKMARVPSRVGSLSHPMAKPVPSLWKRDHAEGQKVQVPSYSKAGEAAVSFEPCHCSPNTEHVRIALEYFMLSKTFGNLQ